MAAEAGRNTLIVSDFHMSEGYLPQTGKWSAHEDFTYDHPFRDFLRYYTAAGDQESDDPWHLLIGGDLFDFLQVVSLPAATPGELKEKLERLKEGALQTARLVAQPQARAVTMGQRLASRDNLQLQPLIDDLLEFESGIAEQQVWSFETLGWELLILAAEPDSQLPEKYQRTGLGTTWEQTCWKLDRIAEGHPIFFQALAEFIADGNSLTLVKGNHDLELHWPQVGERFKLLIADGYRALKDVEITEAMSDEAFATLLNQKVALKPWVAYEDDLLYLEHGSQYESLNAVSNFLRPVIFEDPRYTQLPSGSFLVRYFSNEIEKHYPFVDSVKPSSQFIRWVLRTDFFNFVWIFLRNTPNHFRYLGKVTSNLWRDYRSRRKGDRHNLKSAASKEAFQKLSIEDQESHRALDEMETRGLRQSVQGPLNEDHLEAIMVAAEQIRGNFIGRLFRYGLYVSIILGILIALTVAFFGFVSGVINVFSSMSQNNPVVGFLVNPISAIIGLIVATAMYKLATTIVAGGNYLHVAAIRVHSILASEESEIGGADVRYYVFGHSHEPDLQQIDNDHWYVNSGSWLPVESEVGRWDRRQTDFTYLLIQQGEQKGAPALLRWNPDAAKPERIRLRKIPE